VQSFKDVWDRALTILKNDLNRISYESWIKLLIPMKIESDIAYFCVNTLFQKSIIDQKYKNEIEQALANVMGFPITIKVMTEDEVPPRFRDVAQRKNEEVNTILPKIEAEEIREFNIQPALTFDTFVIGKENEFAHAAAMAIPNDPAGAYNPYFLYGHSGLGKTHLINAIANKIREDNPNMAIMYVKGDEFTSELIDAIQFNRQREFKNKYRRADILMVDDVQFISGKKAIQEEFFHTFDALYENNRQIILTSDRPPQGADHAGGTAAIPLCHGSHRRRAAPRI
jgi:chromosomal replication initiator protein